MIYVRGQPEDFDHWGQLGNRGWSWDDVLPYFKRGRELGGRRRRIPRQGRAAADLAHRRQAASVPQDHRGRTTDRARIPRRRQPSAARRRRQYRLGAADAPRPAAAERGAHLSAPGDEAAQPRGHHRRARASRRCSTASARPASSSRAASAVERAEAMARGDPLRRRDRLAASAATVGVGDPEHLGRIGIGGPPRAARGRQEFAGPFPRPRHLRGQRHSDRQREVARPAVRRRDHALSV